MSKQPNYVVQPKVSSLSETSKILLGTSGATTIMGSLFGGAAFADPRNAVIHVAGAVLCFIVSAAAFYLERAQAAPERISDRGVAPLARPFDIG